MTKEKCEKLFFEEWDKHKGNDVFMPSYMRNKELKLEWTRYRRDFKMCGQYDTLKHTIRLQPRYVEINSKQNILNTIRHEQAHALTPFHGHDKIWKQVCKLIGGDGHRLAPKSTKSY